MAEYINAIYGNDPHKEIAALKAEIENLTNEIEILKEENYEFRAENADVHINYIQHDEWVTELRSENAQLREFILAINADYKWHALLRDGV